MRKFLTLFLLALAGFTVKAQQIEGLVKDAEGKALAGATVSLMKDTSTAILKFTVSKEDGSYNFADIAEGNYKISVSHVGFDPSFSAPFAVSSDKVTVPAITLVKSTGAMDNITVVARKPIIEVKADKTILNVEGTINSVGSDALELLRKSPGVTVDKDENLTLAGKNGVQVYIDGRPTPLSGQDLANYLKSLQSSNIESIELITNPSAKYEAAGNAGIINIRLKKNKSFGTNGSVNAGWNIGVYAKYNAGLNLNYRNKSMNLFASYSYNQGKNWSKLNIDRSIGDTAFAQRGTITFDNRSHNFKAGADFFLSKKSTVGIMVNGTISDPEVDNKSHTPIIFKPTNTVDRILTADNSSTVKRDNANLNLNYTYNGPKGRSLVLNADHGIYDINSNQYQPNFYYDPTGNNVISSVIYRMIAPTDITISSFKADYEQDMWKGKLGLGGKISYVESDNDFQRYDVVGGNDILDKDRSNRFVYEENINALYANYNRALKGMIIQFGVRMENTIAKGTSTGEKNNGGGYDKYDSSFKRNYVDFFPSAAVTFNKNPMSQWSLTYSRRIDRPAYQDLNPFEFKLDEYTFQRGNINLKPQYTNSFGVSHTYKFKLTTALNYSHVEDLFTQWIDTTEKSKSFLNKRNLATQDIISLNVSYPFMYKNYMLFANLNTNYSRFQADFGPGREVDADAFGLNLFAQNTLKFGKTKTWTAELSGFYNAPTIYMGSFEAKSLWAVDAGLQKQLFQGKGTIKASVSDVFRSLRFRATNDFAGQHTNVLTRWESRQFKLNFVYRFGSNQVKAARNRTIGAEDETKRASQQGGAGIGIGQ